MKNVSNIRMYYPESRSSFCNMLIVPLFLWCFSNCDPIDTICTTALNQKYHAIIPILKLRIHTYCFFATKLRHYTVENWFHKRESFLFIDFLSDPTSNNGSKSYRRWKPNWRSSFVGSIRQCKSPYLFPCFITRNSNLQHPQNP